MDKIKKKLVFYKRTVFNWFFNGNSFKNEGKNNKIYLNKSLIKNTKAIIHNNNNLISIGENTTLSNCFFDIKGNNNIVKIGDNCRIGKTEFWIKGNNCTIELKNNVYIRSAHIACGDNQNIIEIGNNCLIAYNVEIRNNDSHYIFDLSTNEQVNKPQNILIEDKVWIGGNTTILKGVKVGKGSVIGGGSIVTKSVDENSIYVGSPAKKIKSNIYWES